MQVFRKKNVKPLVSSGALIGEKKILDLINILNRREVSNDMQEQYKRKLSGLGEVSLCVFWTSGLTY